MVGIRRAIVLLILGFYVTQFGMTAALGPDELFPAYLGLALCYGLTFVGLAAEWFWARWFAMGVGNFGSIFLLLTFKVGFEPIIVFLGATHLAVAVLLMGDGMASVYEHSEKTQEKWNFQEESLVLMRRAVKSAGSTIPFLILYALAPRGEVFDPSFAQLAVLVLGAAGLAGLLRARTWSLFALGGAGALALADGLGAFGTPTLSIFHLSCDGSVWVTGHVGILAGGLLAIPLLFAAPMARYLRTLRDEERLAA